MRIGHKVLLAIACTVTALTRAESQTSSQPSTNAHTVQQWVEILGRNNDRTDYANATRAIEYLGTNAIPPLVQWLAYDPGPSAETKGQPWMFDHPELYGDQKQFALANAAVDAFRILGPTAAPALPSLSNIVAVSHSKHSTPRAIQAMSYIRPAALPYLLAILTNGTPRDRSEAALAIAGWGTNARPAVPALILCLTNTVASDSAFKSLAYLNIEPQLVVPAFTNLATNPSFREEAIRMLAALGDNARPALPTITSALNDTNKYVRSSATNTLLRIAPEVITNTPPQ